MSGNQGIWGRQVAGKEIAFAATALLSFFALLVYGLHPLPAPAAEGMAERLQPDRPLDLRADTALPDCDAPVAIRAVQGQLMRRNTAHVVGLTDVREEVRMSQGGRICMARANLAFGTQMVGYSIRNLVAGQKTWELVLVAR